MSGIWQLRKDSFYICDICNMCTSGVPIFQTCYSSSHWKLFPFRQPLSSVLIFCVFSLEAVRKYFLLVLILFCPNWRRMILSPKHNAVCSVSLQSVYKHQEEQIFTSWLPCDVSSLNILSNS